MRILVKFCTQTYGFIVNPVSARNEHFLWIPVIDHNNLCGYYDICQLIHQNQSQSRLPKFQMFSYCVWLFHYPIVKNL